MDTFGIFELPASIRRSTVSSVSLMLARYPRRLDLALILGGSWVVISGTTNKG